MTPRSTFRIPLTPLLGSRFQPTGFPDLGAATFQMPDSEHGWIEALHVESPQSMANRLELTTWDSGAQEQRTELTGLPYVRVVEPEGDFLTSSRLEAHRLASAYIMDGQIDGVEGREVLQRRLGLVKDQAVDHRAFARAVCLLDPLSLVHGVFFAQQKWPWQPKIARAVTCFVDASDVRSAVSGGVKTDSVNPRTAGELKGTKEGYGMVPHQRVEYTAREITAYVSVDHEQIRSYGLGPAGEELLEAIVDFELANLFRLGSLRLRTACDLQVPDSGANSLDGISMPEAAAQRVTAAIAAAADLLGPVTELRWSREKSAAKAKA
ncbi:MAG: type I-G CRISPR-associated RAMP protein Csb1/Cas7g [Dermatophilaceae bacterium]